MLNNQKKKVLISGAGVAGIICAILLDKEKYDVELIEQADTFRNIGFSVVIWKNGFDSLISLLENSGEYLKEEKDYFKADNIILFAGNRLRKIKEVNISDYAFTFERAHLMKILERVLSKNIPKENVSFGKCIKTLLCTEISTKATFNNGLTKEYDFVIIAEGINSTSRSIVPIAERIITVPFVAFYVWFSTQTNLKKNVAIFLTKGSLGVIHPPYFKNLFGGFLKKGLSSKDLTNFEKAALKNIKQPNGKPVIIDIKKGRIFDLKEIYVNSYIYKQIVFVGDAAHGRPPMLGFGTPLAIEDAVSISKILNELEDFSAINVSETLDSFSSTRIKRVESVYKLQNFCHRLFITDNPIKVFLLALSLKLFLSIWIKSKVKNLINSTV